MCDQSNQWYALAHHIDIWFVLINIEQTGNLLLIMIFVKILDKGGYIMRVYRYNGV